MPRSPLRNLSTPPSHSFQFSNELILFSFPPYLLDIGWKAKIAGQGHRSRRNDWPGSVSLPLPMIIKAMEQQKPIWPKCTNKLPTGPLIPHRLYVAARPPFISFFQQEAVDPTRIAALGYCFGGTAILELARTGVSLAALIGFHPGLAKTRPAESARINAPFLMFLGDLDEIKPAEQRRAFEDEMNAAGVDWRSMIFGRAGHSFTNPEADALNIPHVNYDATADSNSWPVPLSFLREMGVLQDGE